MVPQGLEPILSLPCKYVVKTIKLNPPFVPPHTNRRKKEPQLIENQQVGVSVGGPTWARTRDQLIMSQLL